MQDTNKNEIINYYRDPKTGFKNLRAMYKELGGKYSKDDIKNALNVLPDKQIHNKDKDFKKD